MGPTDVGRVSDDIVLIGIDAKRNRLGLPGHGDLDVPRFWVRAQECRIHAFLAMSLCSLFSRLN